MPKPLVLLLAVFFLLSPFAKEASAQQGEDTRPNIVLILTDDQRADTIRAWGNPHILTPALDAIVARGTSFRRNYCLGSGGGAVCVPSRAMIHSGRDYHGLNLSTFEGSVPLGAALERRGYRTFGTGKWHNGRGSFDASFQTARNVMFSGMSDHVNVPVCDLGPEGFSPGRQSTTHSSELFASSAVEFLHRHGKSGPFFLSVAFSAPHDPRDPPRPWAHRCYENRPPVPANFMEQHPFDNGMLVLRDEKLAAWPRTEDVVREQLAEYYGLIEHLDSQIARITAALDALPKDRPTLIIYAADHGLALGSHGLLGKQNLYEHSMRAPLVIAGPGFPEGQTSNALTYLTDIYATALSAAGEPHERDPRFCRDLAPAAAGADPAPRDSLYLSMAKSQRAVTDGRWKLLRYPLIDHTQLFDLATDPCELVNLAQRPEHQARVGTMLDDLRAWQAAAGDEAPLSVDEPTPFFVDLTDKERKPDRWQPRWIRQKYFGEAFPSDDPGSLGVIAKLLTEETGAQIECWLKRPSGEVEFSFYSPNEGRLWEGLTPGDYSVAVKLPLDHGGPWIYVQGAAQVAPGSAATLDLAAPEERSAQLTVRPDKGCPPFALWLSKPGTNLPSDPRQLGERIAQGTYPDGFVFALMSDGRSGAENSPALPAGTYEVTWMANDHVPADPTPMGRTLTVELKAGQVTTLELKNSLTSASVVHE